MNFNGLTNNITKKFNQIKSSLPDIGKEIDNHLANIKNELSLDSALSRINPLNGLPAEFSNNFLSAAQTPSTYRPNLPGTPGSVGTPSPPGQLVPGKTPPPWSNELEGFATMNSIITLAALSRDEINKPDTTYRLNGPKYVVLRSGGSSDKVRTVYEQVLGASVEFFIDNLEFQSTMVPSREGRTSNMNMFSFDVIEPYSMGLFWETLRLAANAAGYRDYTDAPFLLIMDFMGTDEEGNTGMAPYSRRMVPLKLTKSEFSVDGGGSKYSVSGIAWNEQALTDTIQQVKTDIAITGRTVKEMLQTGAQSLTTIMNSRLLDMQEKKQVNTADQFVILFPEDRSSSTGTPLKGSSDASKTSATADPWGGFGAGGEFGSGTSTPSDPWGGFGAGGEFGTSRTQTLDELFQSISGDATATVPVNFDEFVNSISALVTKGSEINEMLKLYATSDISSNSIGKSNIIEDFQEAGDMPFGNPKFTRADISAKYPIFKRGDSQLQLSGENRIFKFKSGSRIQDIIEEVLITSTFGRSLALQLADIKDPTGMVTWFRIETDVFSVADSAQIDVTGSTPRIYVYRVVPYKVHHSVFSAPTAPSVGLSNLKKECAKEYNYIYTGKNKDVLDFEIKFNQSFIYPSTADRASSTATQTTGAAGTATAGNSEQNYATGGDPGYISTYQPPEGAQKQSESVSSSSGNTGGAGIDNSAIGIARMFNDRLINSKADMQEIELSILGDPFYLSDDGLGNYHSTDTSYTNMNTDGHMSHTNGQVHINILFRTPIDYDVGNGGMIFPEDTIIIEQFSGIYRVNEVIHRISGNQFTQILKATRVPKQTTAKVTSNTGVFIPITNPLQALNEKANDLQKIATSAITKVANNSINYQNELDLLLPSVQNIGSIVEQAKASLNSASLSAFGNIGALSAQIQSNINLGNLSKVGTDFQNLANNVKSFSSEVSSLASKVSPTLNNLQANASTAINKLNSNLRNIGR